MVALGQGLASKKKRPKAKKEKSRNVLQLFWTFTSLILIWLYQCNLKANLTSPKFEKSIGTLKDFLYPESILFMYRFDLNLLPVNIQEELKSVQKIVYIEKDDFDRKLAVNNNQCFLLRRPKGRMFQNYLQKKTNVQQVELTSDFFNRQLIFWSTKGKDDLAPGLTRHIMRLQESGVFNKVLDIELVCRRHNLI